MRLRRDNSTGEERRANGAAGEQRAHRPIGSRRPLRLLVSLGVLLALGVSLAATGTFAKLLGTSVKAPAPAAPPAPTIGAAPSDPTNQNMAHFTYTDSQAGVTYECQLDGAGFSSCPSTGITYGPLSDGSHTFKVRAVAGSKTSSAVSYPWTIDTKAPSATVSSPANAATLAAGDWGGRCSEGATICGNATDSGGVSAVVISIQREGGQWWGGSSFDQGSEHFLTAHVESPGKDSTRWSYQLPLPADGAYTVHVRATDRAGNQTSSAAQASTHFVIDTTPPPVPSINTKPAAVTTAKDATFTFSDSEGGVKLLCKRDGARFSTCTSPTSYSKLTVGEHTFQVQARDAVGNLSAPASYSWTIVKELPKETGKPFTVSGDASGPLAPGVTRTLAITVSNPNNVAISVTALTASVVSGSTKAGCDGPTNLQLTQSNVSEANVLTVPANGQVTLPAGAVSAPQVLMKNLPVNQDACKGATFSFSYSGSAHS
ncbi:MAG TPA: Ig-like domain-containing protein [Solirubrobacteraceae bacterium]|nr:Ig-like domain-containing protein [Solirubrobacteraceae bacterium]